MSDPFHVLQICLAFAVAWYFWHFCWRSYRLDSARQALFSLRDDLFDMALRQDRGLTFDSPEYGVLRSWLNCNIRFAHRLTFYNVWISAFMAPFCGRDLKEAMKNYKSPAELAIESVTDQELKKKLGEIYNRILQIRVKQMLSTSPLFICCAIVAALAIIITLPIHGGLRLWRKSLRERIKMRQLESARPLEFQTGVLGSQDLDEACAA